MTAAVNGSLNTKPQFLGANGETKADTREEGKRGQGAVGPLMRINVDELMKIVKDQHQEAESVKAESEELTREMVHLRVAAEQLAAGNADNRKRIEEQNQLLRINGLLLGKLKRDQCCTALSLILLGLGGVGGGTAMIVGKAVREGVTLVVTGAGAVGVGAATSDCNKKC